MADPNQLAEPLGSFVRFAMLTARKQGRGLTLTSGLRTRAQQIELRRKHCGTSHHAIYETSARNCSPPTARPGSSNHETGNAADMRGAKAWMAALLRPYGVTRPVAGEDWHFEYRGGNPARDLQKLSDNMKASGYTSSEFAQVFPQGQPAGGGSFSITTPFGRVSIPVGKVLSPASGILDAAPNPFAAVTELYDTIQKVTDIISDREFWVRVGTGLGGVVLLNVGIVLMFSDRFAGAVSSITSEI